jgi:hypothetical protein
MKEIIQRLMHLALVARRIEAIGREASADTFLTTSYLVEATIKTLALVLASAIRERAPEDAYHAEYDCVRADGLGTWTDVIERDL